MSKVLRLYNSFTRSINDTILANGKAIVVNGNNGRPTLGSLYICGPTVYSDTHLGHALTYVRADLFRRFMRSLFNVKLITVMNITDIDDKILARTRDDNPLTTQQSSPLEHPFRNVSERYYKQFNDDLNYIRVKPPDLSIRVSDQIDLIIAYIKKLERSGHAYLASNGDIYFRVASVKNYVGRTDSRKSIEELNSEETKQDIRDFALWKAAKPNEPVWMYKSDVTGREVPGRPGWHVQCSAISSAIFGDKLDFHYGGKDLIFPHHYNEQACCCAYHNLDTSQSFHVWSNNWLHSGHLVLRDEKMSKSLGNVLGIRNFINDSSVNALRLLCVDSHYRADVNFNEELLQNTKSLDHKISAFANHLSELMQQISQVDLGRHHDNNDLEAMVQQVNDEIVDGVCDDLDLNKGLTAILNLSKKVYSLSLSDIRPKDLVSVWQLLVDWCEICGLEYGPTSKSYDENLVQLVQDFRQTIRLSAIDEVKRRKQSGISKTEKDPFLESILENCDSIRAKMDEFGFVIRDKKT